jgi:hypothetical protein
MSTIVHYECRNLDHMRAGSRRGKGGLVFHHGTVGYCDGLHVDGAHHWVATGGVPIEFLVETAPAIDPGTYRSLRVAVKLSDDPEWPDGSASHTTLLRAD